MNLGNFCVCLLVRDLSVSRAFYEKLGFTAVSGNADHGYLVMKNGNKTKIGLFQGHIEKNLLCFNPGWDDSAQKLDDFTDVREIQRRLREAGITPVIAADETTTGPAHFTLVDPDGNPILVDQHV